MFKLIRLEWKKNNVGKYIRNAVIMAALICLFIFALCYLGIANDPETGVPDAAPGNSAVSPSIELFTSMAFLIFTGVMLSAYIVNAYKNKTMNLMFYHFIEDKQVRLIGCEAAGRGIDTAETAATIATGKPGIFHGMKSYFCQDQYGQIAPVYSISAGLDYPGVGPEHSYLHDIGRAEYVPVTDEEAVGAFEYLARTEGIIPAIESAHAVAHGMKIAPAMETDKIVVITISGRGDKDCASIARYRGENIYE